MSRDMFRKKCKIVHTCVLWDVEDFQVPDGHDPDWVYKKIKSALEKKGYECIVEIRAYGEKNKIWDAFLLAGIMIIPKGDKYARVNKMIKDILFWALDNPVEESVQRNVMVISKNMSRNIDEFLSILHGLQSRGYKVFLAESDDDNVESIMQHEFVSSVWLWKSLLDGGNPISKSRRSSQSVDYKLKRKETSTATCSGSSEGAPKANESGAEDTDSQDMKSKISPSREPSLRIE
ncbi:NYN domain limkain-b1-type [Arabidopsis suecica]|uniref:NYN domain limkain-b1-type n=1 Tax=Arabidopsis suecica TaxID=45249 RepID=A0A8T2CMW7_ARASU|nr:NYN domain limkain-b1-type [Arabidopsis suecica]